jgi:SAM-dependent methyltransferase
MQLPITLDNLSEWFPSPAVENPLVGDPWFQVQCLGTLVAVQLLRLVPAGDNQQQALIELRRGLDTALLSLTPPPDAEVHRRLAQTLAPFSPSPFEVVEAMLDLADLNPADDLLLDLGSGDGRVVLAASQRGVRSFGVEIDPQLVGLAFERMSEHPDYARASFIHDDVQNVDLTGASVITCYLLSSSMIALREKFRALRPGTRIISHAFDMPGWPPVRTITTASGLGPIHLWVV